MKNPVAFALHLFMAMVVSMIVGVRGVLSSLTGTLVGRVGSQHGRDVHGNSMEVSFQKGPG
jgi:hypothetical protein